MAISHEQYRVWSPDLAEDEDDCRLIMAYDHEEAARKFVSDSYHDEAFEDAMNVMVRCTFGGDEGELKAFSVSPEPSVHFYVNETQFDTPTPGAPS